MELAKEKSRKVREHILKTAVGPILVIVGKIDLLTIIIDLLKNKGVLDKNLIVNANFMNNVFVIIGILIPALFNLKWLKLEVENKAYTKQIEYLLRFQRETFTKAFLYELGIRKEAEFDIKIYILQKKRFGFIKTCVLLIKDKVSRKGKSFDTEELVLKNIDGLTNLRKDRNQNYQISPIPEGLVAKCYNNKKIVFDDNFEYNKDNDNEYHLKEHQKDTLRNIKWWACKPIFDSKTNRICAIISFESEYSIKILDKKRRTAETIISNFTEVLTRSIPNYIE